MSDVSLPYTLTPGTPENVSHVQANDEALRDFVNGDGWCDNSKLATGSSGLALGSFSAYRNAAYSATAAAAKVPYDATEWSIGGYFDTSNGRFTPGTAGYYRFSAFQRIATTNANAYLYLYLYKNGALHKVFGADGIDGAGNTCVVSGSVLASANGTTDYFEVYAQHNEAGSWPFSTGTAFSIFQGELVGKS